MPGHSPARIVIAAGVILIAVGLAIRFLPSIPVLGKLPGDFRIERPGFRLYLPLASCLVVSLILSVILWIASRLR
jgi:hypothetical protein